MGNTHNGDASKGWRELEHTADLALLIWGKNWEELFIQAAEGMYAFFCGESQNIRQPAQHTFALSAVDVESLFVEWLNELLYLADIEKFWARTIQFEQFTRTNLRVLLKGEIRPSLDVYIKAATYHELMFQTTANGIWTQVVFDV